MFSGFVGSVLDNPYHATFVIVMLAVFATISLNSNSNFFRRFKSSIGVSLLSATAAFLFTFISEIAVETGGWLDREFVVVFLCLAVVGASSIATVVFAPSRMTVIAGITVSLIIAVLIVEAGLWLNGYMRGRLSDEIVSLIVSSNGVYGSL